MSLKTDLSFQMDLLDVAEMLVRIKTVTLPDALENGLTVFQRKYLLRVLSQMGEDLEECIGKIHGI